MCEDKEKCEGDCGDDCSCEKGWDELDTCCDNCADGTCDECDELDDIEDFVGEVLSDAFADEACCDGEGDVPQLLLPAPIPEAAKESMADEAGKMAFFEAVETGRPINLGISGTVTRGEDVFGEEVEGGVALVQGTDGEKILLLFCGDLTPVGMNWEDVQAGRFDVQEEFTKLAQEYINNKHGMLVKRKNIEETNKLKKIIIP